MNTEVTAITAWTTDQLLAHWQGHRGLTRKVIEAFPEKELFEYSIGGMRPFSELAMEMIVIAEDGMTGILTREWAPIGDGSHTSAILKEKSKAALLEKWDHVTAHINAIWPQLDEADFLRIEKAFGAYENTNLKTIQYAIDNEIHHRGQGYVYLRSLGIQPPFFWEH